MSKKIDALVREGKLRQVLGKSQEGTCMTEGMEEALLASGATEFANFAYTDYGCLTAGGGRLDHDVIRLFGETYRGEGMSVSPTGWNGKDMVLTGDALTYLKEEVMGGRDGIQALLDGMYDTMERYRAEACAGAARILAADLGDGHDTGALALAIGECDSCMGTGGEPDFAEEAVLEAYGRIMEGRGHGNG